ncbi:sarcosine oxidase subunit delta [Roseovarius sp. B08]|uniref:sarcosine oxidase subunit delta n=1 Tax=Roseovarius sp. B08 TaxID=3449223 RepID=UPI003EDC9ED5
MRLPCPICGERDRREFYYAGHAVALERPCENAGAEAWDDYVHNRENPCGETRDLWFHESGCGAWIVVTRDTSSHAVLSAVLAEEAAR